MFFFNKKVEILTMFWFLISGHYTQKSFVIVIKVFLAIDKIRVSDSKFWIIKIFLAINKSKVLGNKFWIISKIFIRVGK